MHLQTLVGESDKKLFYKMCNQAHCLHFVFPHLASAAIAQTRHESHLFELPQHKYDTLLEKVLSYGVCTI